MKIIIPGGSGQVGTILARAFARDGHEVVLLSRKPTAGGIGRTIFWDARTLGDWAAEFEAADSVINMSGRSVNCRYTPANRKAIVESRVDSTRVVGEAIAKCKRPPRVWLQAATATIYAHRYDAPNDEFTGIIGGSEPDAPDTWRFSIAVAKSWEETINEANTPLTRKVILRSAMTMSPDAGGVFDVLLRLVRFRLGGKAGDGRQYVSWIHEEDFVRAIYFLIERDNFSGPVNLAAPHPLSNADFMHQLREAAGVRIGLPAARWMLEVGAFFMRTETELILKSRRVFPGLLAKRGFQFKFPSWDEAAGDLYRRRTTAFQTRNPR